MEAVTRHVTYSTSWQAGETLSLHQSGNEESDGGDEEALHFWSYCCTEDRVM